MSLSRLRLDAVAVVLAAVCSTVPLSAQKHGEEAIKPPARDAKAPTPAPPPTPATVPVSAQKHGEVPIKPPAKDEKATAPTSPPSPPTGPAGKSAAAPATTAPTHPATAPPSEAGKKPPSETAKTTAPEAGKKAPAEAGKEPAAETARAPVPEDGQAPAEAHTAKPTVKAALASSRAAARKPEVGEQQLHEVAARLRARIAEVTTGRPARSKSVRSVAVHTPTRTVAEPSRVTLRWRVALEWSDGAQPTSAATESGERVSLSWK